MLLERFNSSPKAHASLAEKLFLSFVRSRERLSGDCNGFVSSAELFTEVLTSLLCSKQHSTMASAALKCASEQYTSGVSILMVPLSMAEKMQQMRAVTSAILYQYYP